MSASNERIKCSYTWKVENPNLRRTFTTNVNGEYLRWILYLDYTGHPMLKAELQCSSSISTEVAAALSGYSTSTDGTVYEGQQNKSNLNSCYKFDVLLKEDLRIKSASIARSKDLVLIVICEIFYELPKTCSWEDNSIHSSVINELTDINKFDWFFDNMSDVRIIIGDQEFPAHKKILALRSRIFSTMFDRKVKSKIPVVSEDFIKIDNVDSDVMRELLRFIYTDKVQDINKYCGPLLEVAKTYGIDDLQNLCERKLKQRLPSNS